MTAPLTPEQVADVLDDAADYIEAHGWCKDTIEDGDGRRCAVGAIYGAVDANLYLPGGAWHESRHAFATSVGVYDDRQCIDHIPAWNDAPGRTKQEVLDAFRAAAKEQRSRRP